MDFFQSICQEPPLNHSLFGLCDDQNGRRAYTDVKNQRKWIATVKNDKNKSLIFTAIDKCVIKDHEEPGRGRCDGMLTSDEHIYFVELKDEAKGWIADAIEQLESTVKFFIANHDLNDFKHKKAFVCNKKHSPFREVDNERNLSFFRNYRVRIDVQAEILII